MKMWVHLLAFVLIALGLVLWNLKTVRLGEEADHKGKEERRFDEGGMVKVTSEEERRGRAKNRLSERSERERSSWVKTESGLSYEILHEGSGDSPGPNDKVEVHYEGRLEDGTVFDSSYERHQPTSFPLNMVIKGWTEGVQLMKPGGKAIFKIPANLAYGDRSTGSIPAGATLIFEIELVSVKTRN